MTLSRRLCLLFRLSLLLPLLVFYLLFFHVHVYVHLQSVYFAHTTCVCLCIDAALFMLILPRRFRGFSAWLNLAHLRLFRCPSLFFSTTLFIIGRISLRFRPYTAFS